MSPGRDAQWKLQSIMRVPLNMNMILGLGDWPQGHTRPPAWKRGQWRVFCEFFVGESGGSRYVVGPEVERNIRSNGIDNP